MTKKNRKDKKTQSKAIKNKPSAVTLVALVFRALT